MLDWVHSTGSITVCAQVPQTYVLISKVVTWIEAQSYCRENHTDLVTIKSLEDMKEMSRVAAANGVRGMMWIGLKKSKTGSSGDGWKWSDQSPSTFRRWESSQPNNDGSCVLYSPTSNNWWDRSCQHKFSFFCYNGELFARSNWTGQYKKNLNGKCGSEFLCLGSTAVAKGMIVEMESSSSLDLSDPKMSDALLNQASVKFSGSFCCRQVIYTEVLLNATFCPASLIDPKSDPGGPSSLESSTQWKDFP